MLFNLTKFITWPRWKMDESHPFFSVCILGSAPLGPQLDSFLHNKTVGGKAVVVGRLTSIDAAYACHILYVGASERKAASHAYLELAKASVLTISEGPNVDNVNQIIGLPSAEDHVRIDVNLGLALQSGLVISSKLLQLATVSH